MVPPSIHFEDQTVAEHEIDSAHARDLDLSRQRDAVAEESKPHQGFEAAVRIASGEVDELGSRPGQGRANCGQARP